MAKQTCSKLIAKARRLGKKCNKGHGKCMDALTARHAVTRAGCKVTGVLEGLKPRKRARRKGR
jgi:hypothetical protein